MEYYVGGEREGKERNLWNTWIGFILSGPGLIPPKWNQNSNGLAAHSLSNLFHNDEDMEEQTMRLGFYFPKKKISKMGFQDFITYVKE